MVLGCNHLNLNFPTLEELGVTKTRTGRPPPNGTLTSYLPRLFAGLVVSMVWDAPWDRVPRQTAMA
jgi:hypothetical protein